MFLRRPYKKVCLQCLKIVQSSISRDHHNVHSVISDVRVEGTVPLLFIFVCHKTVLMLHCFQNGSGPNSEWVHVDTPLEDKDEGQVAGPPMSLKVQPSYDSIQLSWLPPRDERVMIRGYLVGWRLAYFLRLIFKFILINIPY